MKQYDLQNLKVYTEKQAVLGSKFSRLVAAAAALLLIAGYILYLHHEIKSADRYIENVNANCIVLRKSSPVKDLQEWFNKQGNERYACGEEDGIPGPKLRKAAHNWMCDYAAGPYFEEQE